MSQNRAEKEIPSRASSIYENKTLESGCSGNPLDCRCPKDGRVEECETRKRQDQAMSLEGQTRGGKLNSETNEQELR